jgi:L-rhamnose-H+ transport protein
LAFSLAGMLVCNWIFTLLFVPHAAAIFAAVPPRDLLILIGFGIAWGIGAVMFGLGMDMLGLTLGYPLIMGLNASVGTFVPLVSTYGREIFAGRRAFIAVGLAIAIAGISACSLAGAWRQSTATEKEKVSRSRFTWGLIVACASGFLSCLPNLGLTFGSSVIRTAQQQGVSPAFAGNAVWFIFFTFGGIINVLYCSWLMSRRKNTFLLIGAGRSKNWLWGLVMGILWISGFYLYAVGTARLGTDGVSIGWPIMVALSMGAGVMCGLSRGEWNGTPARAKALLSSGLALIVLAVIIIPMGTAR